MTWRVDVEGKRHEALARMRASTVKCDNPQEIAQVDTVRQTVERCFLGWPADTIVRVDADGEVLKGKARIRLAIYADCAE